jgi:hypothetical protein
MNLCEAKASGATRYIRRDTLYDRQAMSRGAFMRAFCCELGVRRMPSFICEPRLLRE